MASNVRIRFTDRGFVQELAAGAFVTPYSGTLPIRPWEVGSDYP